MENVKERMDIYFDKSAPSIVVDIREYRDGYLNIRNRGGEDKGIYRDYKRKCRLLQRSDKSC